LVSSAPEAHGRHRVGIGEGRDAKGLEESAHLLGLLADQALKASQDLSASPRAKQKKKKRINNERESISKKD